MIRRVLIANRGEIAVRIAHACRELGVETVAVYSEADARAPHVAAADRAVCIGPAAARDSYLSIPSILQAVASTAADAVHPGYGFLSENASFAEACERAGIIFVGPPSAVIARMGSKIEARRVMESAGVPVVPGETPDDQSDEGLRRSIDRVGLPALIKASAGGGGKGMRRVLEPGAIAEAVAGARREAIAAFGDGTLYVERLIERARHVEVQILADHHGHVLHLFERECSVQRRHQKVIEESPSPSVTPDLRRRITSAAVQAATAAGYRNAGTIEFLLERSSAAAAEPRFHFLEMNTRLQVEHPVTEEVTGLDLVRAQLIVASGEPLPWLTPPAQRGHAIEARVYAEDPADGFLPQAGRVLLYREPRAPGVRIDSGIAEGLDIPVHYDPLLAKVIASAETRELARRRLIAALRNFPILGIRTNVPFLLRILDEASFRAGDVDTTFLDRSIEPGGAAINVAAADPPDFVRTVMAGVDDPADDAPPDVQPRRAWDPWQPRDAASAAATTVRGRGARPGLTRLAPGMFSVAINDLGNDLQGTERREIVYAAGPPDDRWSFWNGAVFHLDREDERTRNPGPGSRRVPTTQRLSAPMPATVIRVLVTPGSQVRKGDVLVLLEAMKMELPIRALSDGTVTVVHCRDGELVQADQILVEAE
ncbi:MAG: biotin carboxylase N-terminal domain-containing protein [Acidobacteriota bacterium]